MRDLKAALEEPKKKKEPQEEVVSVPFLVYLKGFFLFAVIVFGMIVLNSVATSKRNQGNQKTSQKLNFSPQKYFSALDKDTILQSAQDEITSNTYYNKAVTKIEKGRDQVLGEATKAASLVAEKAKDTVFDYLYDHTLGTFMEDMIKRMPPEQKQKLIEKVSDK